MAHIQNTTMKPLQSKPTENFPLLLLPPELILELLPFLSARSVSALAKTCRCLHYLSTPFLFRHRTAREHHISHRAMLLPGNGSLPIFHASKFDQVEILTRMATYQNSKRNISTNDLDDGLCRSVSYGSFRAADWFLRNGSEPVYTTPYDGQRCRHKELEDNHWLGSLHVAAKAWYLTGIPMERPYQDEREFWRWKRRVLLRIMWHMRLHAIKQPLNRLGDALLHLQKELDTAVVYAAGSEGGHAVDALRLFVTAGANLSYRIDIGTDWYSGHQTALSMAMETRTPCVFRAKLEFLAAAGADLEIICEPESFHLQAPSLEWSVHKLHVAWNIKSDTLAARARSRKASKPTSVRNLELETGGEFVGKGTDQRRTCLSTGLDEKLCEHWTFTVLLETVFHAYHGESKCPLSELAGGSNTDVRG